MLHHKILADNTGQKQKYDAINNEEDAKNDERNASRGHRGKVSPSRVLIICLAFFLAACVGASVCLRKSRRADGFARNFRHTRNPPLTTTMHDTDATEECTCRDPIAMLKATSAVEELENGAVAADDERCSIVGAAILREHGGNAIDAAVATTLCLQVVNPSASSLGGGAFILLHANADTARNTTAFDDKRKHPYGSHRNKKVTEFIDCRETAPAGSKIDMFEEDPDASWNGGLAIAVPGQLRGLELAHSRHGNLPWSTVVEPAMKLARDGIIVSQNLAHAINLKSSRAKIFKHEHLKRLLTKDHHEKVLLQEGDTLTNPALAKTFQAIMKEGADSIYEGKTATGIAKEIQDSGGIITDKDLSEYRPTLRDPLVAKNIRGFTLVGAPPPSSGGAVVIGMARFLSGYAEDFSAFKDTLSKHRLIESMKHAYAIRMSLSDPAFSDNITAKAVKDLIQGSYMEELRRQTPDDGVLPLSKYGGEWGLLKDEDIARGSLEVTEEGHDNRRRTLRAESSKDYAQSDKKRGHRNLRLFQYLEDHGTTAVVVIDKWGNALAMTTTINTYFGSGVVSPSTGIIFNSQMDDFASPGLPNHYGLAPSETNYIEPGKKPLSSISPTLVFRSKKQHGDDMGKLVMALGASGGPKIPTAVAQVFVNYCFLGMPLYESVAAPRVHDQLLFQGHPVTLYDRATVGGKGHILEVNSKTKEALTKRGHQLHSVVNTGSAQAVAIDQETNRITAVSDIRKGGRAAGY